MDTLDGTDWDVVIAGTGLPQSLLALSLSRSGKKVLHLDQNDYYGGIQAALSLSEAETWAAKHAVESSKRSAFSHASVEKPAQADGSVKLSQPRAYSLALAPQVIHTQSNLLPALVSSRTQDQLDFQAVGSWFVVEPSSDGSAASKVVRVPSGREDIFQDTTFDLRAKRSLMKFLRFVGNYEEQPETWQDEADTPFPDFLERKFGLPQSSHLALLSLTLATSSPSGTSTGFALPRIARHLRSIGLFGPGFGAVLPKWGGMAEIAQVACRAGAVGGGVYVLKKGIQSSTVSDEGKMELVLSDGEKVSTAWLAGGFEDLPASSEASKPSTDELGLTRSISIVSSPIPRLFPPTSEGGVTPAGAVVVVPSTDTNEPPVQIIVHSSDSGECPSTQSVLYASVALPHERGQSRLVQAVKSLLQGTDAQAMPSVLWSLQYYQKSMKPRAASSTSTLVLSSMPLDLALAESVLLDVRWVWQRITGADELEFLKFDAREGTKEDDS